MKKEAEGSAEAPKTEVGGGWTTTLCCVLRRLDEREEHTRISLTSPFARTFLSVPFYIFYRSLSFRARSRDFPLASLVLSSLPYPRLSLSVFLLARPSHLFHSFALVSSFSVLRRICRPACLSVAHPPRRVSRLRPPRASVSLLLCPRRAFRPRAGRADRAALAADWPPHGPQDRARGRSLLLCSDRCGDPREERKRKR